MANIKKYNVIREAESSLKRYKKLLVLIDNTMEELFFYRDLVRSYSDDSIKKRIKEQVIRERESMDRYLYEKALILDIINEIEHEQLQEVLKCVYIDNKSLVMDLGYSAAESIKLKDEALFEYGMMLRERKKNEC